MGMYDELRFDTVIAPRCGEGHPITYFQTKDLTCSMNLYFVTLDKEVFKLEREGWSPVENTRAFGKYARYTILEDRSKMLLTTQHTAVFDPNLHATARIYNGCGKCKPVLVTTTEPKLWSGDLIDERGSSFEYQLEIVAGRVTSIKPLICPTRDELKERLLKQGAVVLEDDHPIAAAHFYRKAQEKS